MAKAINQAVGEKKEIKVTNAYNVQVEANVQDIDKLNEVKVVTTFWSENLMICVSENLDYQQGQTVGGCPAVISLVEDDNGNPVIVSNTADEVLELAHSQDDWEKYNAEIKVAQKEAENDCYLIGIGL